ncbi:DUF3307 domain-containing protein [bacterium]|nr:DUF3307 domain-containing protein [bacterium]
MDLFWRFLLAHFIADFPLQTKAIRAIKSKWYGVSLHALIFGFLCVFSLINYRENNYFWPYFYVNKIWLVIGLLTISHLIIDWVKLKLTRKKGRDRLSFFLVDQTLHIGLIYFLTKWSDLTFYATPGQVNWEFFFRLMSMAVFVVWVLPILMFFIRNQIKYDGINPQTQYQEEWHKLAYFERALIFLGLVLGIMGNKLYFLFIPVAIIIRVLLKLNKDNIPIPIMEWIITIILGFLTVLPEFFFKIY